MYTLQYTLAKLEVGFDVCFPGSLYWNILLAWAEWQLYFCSLAKGYLLADTKPKWARERLMHGVHRVVFDSVLGQQNYIEQYGDCIIPIA